MTTEAEIRNNRGDAASLMLAGVDDPQAFDTAMRSLEPREAARLAAAAIIVGRDVVKLTERPPLGAGHVSPRSALEAIIAACRE